jgi:hypothetical protein
MTEEDQLRRMLRDVALPPGVDVWRDRVRAGNRRRAAIAITAAAAAVALVGVGVTMIAIDSEPADDTVLINPPTSTRPSDSPTAGTTTTTTPKSTPSAPPPSSSSPVPGIPGNAQLVRHAGDLHVTTPGATIRDLEVTGTIYVAASNVTLTRVRVVAKGDFAIRQQPGAKNLTVESCDLAGAEHGIRQEDVGLTVRLCDIHGVRVGVSVTSSATLTGTRIHDLTSPPSAYGVYSAGGSGITVTGNTIINQFGTGAAIMLDTVGGAYRDVRIEANVLAGGQVPLFAGAAAAGSSGMRVLGNRFGRGAGGFVRDWDGTRPGNTWRDNVTRDTGQPVTP